MISRARSRAAQPWLVALAVVGLVSAVVALNYRSLAYEKKAVAILDGCVADQHDHYVKRLDWLPGPSVIVDEVE